MRPKYYGTLSSGGKQTTSQVNEKIVFAREVFSFEIESFATGFTYSLDNETTIHEIDPDSVQVFSEMEIKSITIHQTGVQYRWRAMY